MKTNSWSKKVSLAAFGAFVLTALGSQLASANDPTYTLVCGVSQATSTGYGVIAEGAAPMTATINSNCAGAVKVNFKTAAGEDILLEGQANIEAFIPGRQSSSIFVTLTFLASNNAVEINAMGRPLDPRISGDIAEQGLSFSVGKAVSDHFRAGCTIKKSN